MEIIGNVSFYSDDEEIIEILHELPPFEELGNITILKFMQEKTQKSDFGGVIFVNDYAYTLYKFDKHLIKPEDAGLIMTISKAAFAMEQLEIWIKFKEVGMSFSEKIFENITTGLVARNAVQMLYSNKK